MAAAADQPEDVIWLKGGHVVRLTLPLHPDIEARWRKGGLVRVTEDGEPWQGYEFALPGAEPEVPSPPPPGSGGGDGHEHDGDGQGSGDGGQQQGGDLNIPGRPRGNASRVAWAAYAVELGAATEDEAATLTRDELIELTTPPEMRPGHQDE